MKIVMIVMMIMMIMMVTVCLDRPLLLQAQLPHCPQPQPQPQPREPIVALVILIVSSCLKGRSVIIVHTHVPDCQSVEIFLVILPIQ